MEDIAAMLTDVIACLAPTEEGEDPGDKINKIKEDLETYSKKFKSFRNQYEEIYEKWIEDDSHKTEEKNMVHKRKPDIPN